MKTVNVRYPSNLSILGAIVLDKELNPALTPVTGNTQLTSEDEFVENTSGANTITLPTAIDNTGLTIIIKNTAVQNLTVNTLLSQTIDDELTVTLTQYDALTIISNGANWLII